MSGGGQSADPKARVKLMGAGKAARNLGNAVRMNEFWRLVEV
jgi:hypothetical protein